ncbi:glycine cleavage system aminomethyltransferase GcvT [Dysgonomonas sp. 511]|uniref:glycine cleavage system aminomethyltransferase GcvT n=1 Tax=Dysgonomonas sp. 511 TaxID=2302930 RepID=UPI0013D8222D|nr:glycine cleavage system aminomethyltransferase GcvT [Dysgonomonas sp. 511]NDV79641.1 glycine cleavage system aminomethyltransferase GcvT [Dysgonomonas sp. 511]
MKKTPFTDIHIALGAKMHEFAGYNMPIEYTGIIDEHMAVCNSVGVFDVSHMGEIWAKGPRALPFLQRMLSNNLETLEIGKAQYTCIVNEQGGIVDDIIVYHYEPEKYMLVVNASNIEKDWKWLTEHNEERADLENASDNIAQLAIQGPKALATLQKLTKIDLTQIPYYSFAIGNIEGSGLDNVIISNTGYTGAGGFEIYFYPQYGADIWNALFEAGKEFDIKPIGLGARDTLRLEMGFCLYGNDLNDSTSPIEAGLGWITKFTEGKDFTARAILEKQKKEGVERKLCGFQMLEKGIPRHGYDIVNAEDEKIGVVTSGTISPTTKVGIGLGYIKPEYAALNTPVFIKVRNKNLKAEIVKPPFRRL